MKVETKGNGEKELKITIETPFEWNFMKGLVETADPIALTKYLQDKGFVTDGNDVVDLLDLIEKKMEE